MKTLGLNPPTAELDRIRRHFRDPGCDTDLSDDIDLSDPNFAIWVRHNVAAHKQPGYRSEEHTSELQSLMRNSYAVFCLKKKKRQQCLRHTTTTESCNKT